MEKIEFSTLIFAIFILAFLTILTIIKVFNLSIDNTGLIILLFFIVSVAAFGKIEKQEIEEAKQ